LFKNSRNTEVLKPSQIASTSIPRDVLLPTKYNLQKVTRTSTLLSDSMNVTTVPFTNELNDIFNDVESITSFKETLGQVNIDHKLMIDLRELSTYLKIRGVPIQLLVKLYNILDPRYQGTILLS
jgi:hypothetical protein